MARHRRLLVPWWRRSPAKTTIAMSAAFATVATSTAGATHLFSASHDTKVDPTSDTTPLRYLRPVVRQGSVTDDLPAPVIHVHAVDLPTPTTPPTDPITRPTVVLSVVTTGPLPTTPTRLLSPGEKLVYLASLQAGKPYVYGAAGPSAFDCSGLVSYLYQQLGRHVPRTTQAQFDASSHVDQANKEPGDLIFFGTPNHIYHVGIYAGNNAMWVAPHAGMSVQLETIWTEHYYVGAL